jgi:hypothetical protein
VPGSDVVGGCGAGCDIVGAEDWYQPRDLKHRSRMAKSVLADPTSAALRAPTRPLPPPLVIVVEWALVHSYRSAFQFAFGLLLYQ